MLYCLLKILHVRVNMSPAYLPYPCLRALIDLEFVIRGLRLISLCEMTVNPLSMESLGKLSMLHVVRVCAERK